MSEKIIKSINELIQGITFAQSKGVYTLHDSKALLDSILLLQEHFKVKEENVVDRILSDIKNN